MSRFPGRQHAYGQQPYQPSSSSPFTTPERQGPQTPSHRQLADMTLSRVVGGTTMSDNQMIGQDMYNAVTRDLERTRRSHQDLRARYATMENQRSRYLEERNQSDRAAAQANSRCQALEIDLLRLQEELAAVRQRERGLQVELETVRGDLRRARETIQVQSRAITRRQAVETSSLDQATSGVVARYTEDFGFGPRPAAVARPDPRSQLYAPAQPVSNDVRNQLLPPAAISLSRVEWTSEFAALFTKIERFCQEHLNVPSLEDDVEWPGQLADTIARESSPEHVTSLVTDRRTRYLLLTRIILTWIESHCFHIKIIKGFLKEYDTKIHNLHRQYKSAPTASIRRALAQAEADTIMELTQQAGFAEWRTHQTRTGVNTLLSRLASAIPPGVHHALLGQTFETILGEAWRIGLLIAVRTMDVHMWFPPSSETTLFNPRCMLNRDPYGRGGTPDELEKRGARVSLGVTPHVTSTDVLEEKGETKTVHLANVMLRA